MKLSACAITIFACLASSSLYAAEAAAPATPQIEKPKGKAYDHTKNIASVITERSKNECRHELGTPDGAAIERCTQEKLSQLMPPETEKPRKRVDKDRLFKAETR